MCPETQTVWAGLRQTETSTHISISLIIRRLECWRFTGSLWSRTIRLPPNPSHTNSIIQMYNTMQPRIKRSANHGHLLYERLFIYDTELTSLLQKESSFMKRHCCSWRYNVVHKRILHIKLYFKQVQQVQLWLLPATETHSDQEVVFVTSFGLACG